MGCVYIATNNKNQKQYVGMTTRAFFERQNEHYRAVGDTPFHAAIREFGWNNFRWEVVYFSKNVDLLKQIERDLIKSKGTLIAQNGYNISEGGDGKIDGNGCMVICNVCGMPYIVQPKRFNENIKRGHNFVCSDLCHRKSNSITQRGTNNANYRHGKYIKA